jgi:hypothetical protein
MPAQGPELIYFTATKAVAITSPFDPAPTYTVLATLSTLWPMSEIGHVVIIPPATHTAETPNGDVVLVPEPMGLAVITPPSATAPRRCHHLHIKPTKISSSDEGLSDSFIKKMEKMKRISRRSQLEPDLLDFTVIAPSAWLEPENKTNQINIIAWHETTWWRWTLTGGDISEPSTLTLPITDKEPETELGPFTASISNKDTWWFVGQHKVDHKTKGYLALWRRQKDGTLRSESIAKFSELSASPVCGDYDGDGHDDMLVISESANGAKGVTSHAIQVYLWQPSSSTFSPHPWITQDVRTHKEDNYMRPSSQNNFITAFPARESKKPALLIYQQKDRICAAEIISRGSKGSLSDPQTLLTIDATTRCEVLNSERKEILVISNNALQWCQIP